MQTHDVLGHFLKRPMLSLGLGKSYNCLVLFGAGNIAKSDAFSWLYSCSVITKHEVNRLYIWLPVGLNMVRLLSVSAC